MILFQQVEWHMTMLKYRIFGPVVEGGFGLAYILLDKSISINVSCHTSER